MKRLTQDEVIARFKEVHGEKYDYSKVVYENRRTKVTILCAEHGEFDQNSREHWDGQGCPDCGELQCRINKKYTTEQFIKKSKDQHGEKYDYSKVDYIGCRDTVIIICPVHGEFEQVACHHIRANGCPECANSTGEGVIAEILERSGIEYATEFKFDDLHGLGGGSLRFDFHLTESNILIEYDGQQHYEHIESWVSRERYDRLIAHDKRKNEYCKTNGLTLIRLPYTMSTLEIEERILDLVN